MYDMRTRERALTVVAQGRSLNSVSRELGVSRYAIRSWQTRIEPIKRAGTPCPRCQDAPTIPEEAAAYAYLLGLYLGDGCINVHRRGVYFMRITLDNAWAGIIDECETALRAVRPDNSVFRVQRQGCVAVTSTSKHWPCLFPQHGPGMKHTRKIALRTLAAGPRRRAPLAVHPRAHPLGRLPRHQLDDPRDRRRA